MEIKYSKCDTVYSLLLIYCEVVVGLAFEQNGKIKKEGL